MARHPPSNKTIQRELRNVMTLVKWLSQELAVEVLRLAYQQADKLRKENRRTMYVASLELEHENPKDNSQNR